MSSWALPLAAVGEVGEGFFHERTSETLPCQATESALLLGLGAGTPIGRYGTPTLQQLEAGRCSRS